MFFPEVFEPSAAYFGSKFTDFGCNCFDLIVSCILFLAVFALAAAIFCFYMLFCKLILCRSFGVLFLYIFRVFSRVIFSWELS